MRQHVEDAAYSIVLAVVVTAGLWMFDSGPRELYVFGAVIALNHFLGTMNGRNEERKKCLRASSGGKR